MEESKTILALPAIIGDDVANIEIRTPEFQIYSYLSKLLLDLEHPYWNNLPHRYNIELIKDSIIDTFPMTAGQEPLRVIRKEWFKTNLIHFEQTNLMAYFYHDNIDVITPFINDFKTALETLINKLLLSDITFLSRADRIRAGTYSRSQPFLVTLLLPRNKQPWAKVIILADSRSIVR